MDKGIKRTHPKNQRHSRHTNNLAECLPLQIQGKQGGGRPSIRAGVTTEVDDRWHFLAGPGSQQAPAQNQALPNKSFSSRCSNSHIAKPPCRKDRRQTLKDLRLLIDQARHGQRGVHFIYIVEQKGGIDADTPFWAFNHKEASSCQPSSMLAA